MNSSFPAPKIKEHLERMEEENFISSNVDKKGRLVYIVDEFLTDEKRRDLEL